MSINVIMPQMGESIAEGTIIRWIKKPGDKVERDEPLFEISTDKVDAEIPSPAAGVLSEVVVQEGQTVPINTVVAVIDGVGTAAVAPAAKVEAAAAEIPKPAPAAPQAASAPQPAPAPVATTAGPPPSAHDMAQRLGRTPTPEELRSVRSSPLVRRMARENGVDLSQVNGSGIGGRVTKSDMNEFMQNGGSRPAAAAAAPAALPASFRLESPAPAPDSNGSLTSEQVTAMFANERVDVVPLTPMRKKISEHMVASRRTSAHVTTVFEIDMTNVMKLISANKGSYEEKHGVKLTLTPFIVRAICETIKKYPMINAAIIGNHVVYRKEIHMGIAVALDWGLVVPVIRHADEKNILGLCRSVSDLAGRARNKQLKPDELSGGTFTITNPGVYGGLFGTPIINQPQVAILGVGAVVKRAVVIDDAIAIRSMAYFALSFDHRLVDGADADKFMADYKKYVESYTAAML